MTKASFALRSRNPDVLTCIANLSNDEVFTPPELANRMLDTLAAAWAESRGGASIWTDPDVTFLDPFTKSGVFLREITSRLTEGLATAIPDLQDRVDHILTKQIFGIGITQLTAMLARRSLYCSKWANGKHSIARTFTTQDGNVWFERTEHTWLGQKTEKRVHPTTGDEVSVKIPGTGSCQCGAKESQYGRGSELETHAYALIHTDDVKAFVAEKFGSDMHFDIIIGNPPYQLNDGGGEGSSATTLYHRFVEQAKALEPAQLVMVTPARWYSGGKGLKDFRESMLSDGGLAEIHDFQETDLVFPGLNIRGGVSYFRWAREHEGEVRVHNHRKSGDDSIMVRPPREKGVKTFVRHNEAISILRKVREKGEATMDTRVQPRNPYGIPANFARFSTERSAASPVLLFRSRRGSTANREVFVGNDAIVKNTAFVDKVKVLVSKASPGGDEYPHAVLGRPIIAPKGSVSTETYLIVDFPTSETEAENLVTYMQTRFFRFLVSLIKTTQNISQDCFAFVPIQDLSRAWDDSALYAKYNISETESRFIESQVRGTPSDDDADENAGEDDD